MKHSFLFVHNVSKRVFVFVVVEVHGEISLCLYLGAKVRAGFNVALDAVGTAQLGRLATARRVAHSD